MKHDAANAVQAGYYSETAEHYDRMHGNAPEHDRALEIVSQFIGASGASTVLDVGTGTGRGVRFFTERHPNLEIIGVDPVPELLDVAAANGVDPIMLRIGRGEALPFPDRSFDVVCAFGVLHHVRDPTAVVREMQRVSRHAVFISDANRFGQGPLPARLAKLALYKTHLWWPLVTVRHRGHRHHISHGDGLAYSYSVYDNLIEFASWESVSFVATVARGARSRTWLHPLITSPVVLVCAVRYLSGGESRELP